jgi:hypothetical protein
MYMVCSQQSSCPTCELDDVGELFGLLWPLMFAQPHTRAAAILVDQSDGGWLS